MSSFENDPEIQIFQEYLRIPSVHPDVDYEPCIEFLKKQAKSLGLELKVFFPSLKTKPMCVISYPGTNPDLPSIIFSSHMDVVPVSRDNWTHDPFGAEIVDGKIYARGTQDTKGIGTQYLAALRYFIKENIKFKRTIHVLFTADEEIGSVHGMKAFVKTQDFKDLKAGFVLDEGAPMPNDTFMVFRAERSTWRVEFTITGTPGHGSLILPNNAATKLQKLLTRFTEYRESELKRIDNNPLNVETAGTVTSINVTMINGGLLNNVIPSEFTMMVDIRLALDVDHQEFINMFDGWCKEAGTGITYRFEQNDPKYPETVADESNKYWMAFKQVFDELNIKLVPIVCPGATDSRFVRNAGVPALGFSPQNNMPILAHAHDEYVTVESYLKGIEIYKKVIAQLGNLD